MIFKTGCQECDGICVIDVEVENRSEYGIVSCPKCRVIWDYKLEYWSEESQYFENDCEERDYEPFHVFYITGENHNP